MYVHKNSKCVSYSGFHLWSQLSSCFYLTESLLEKFDLSKVIPQTSPLLFHFYSPIWDLASHFSGERNIQSGRLSLFSGQSLTMPLFPTHTPSLWSLLLWSEPRAPTPPSPSPVAWLQFFLHTPGVFTSEFTLSSASFVSYSMGHCHWCTNKYQYSQL